MRNYLLVILTGSILGICVLYYLAFSEGVTKVSALAYIYAAFTGALTGVSVTFLSKFLDNKIKWQSQTGSRLITGIILNAVFSFVLINLIIKLYSLVHELTLNEEVLNFFKIKLAILVVIIIILYSILYFTFYSYNYYHHEQISALTVERKQIDLQLDALKSQLSPHFLFNNLNTISALYLKDKTKAVHFIRKMGICYQYTLNTYHQVLMSLSNELTLVTSYYELLQTRFENQLKISIRVDDALLKKQVPALSIQMLVENAIKHNKIVKNELLEIDIVTIEDTIQVSNNITVSPDSVESFKVGLANIEKRYKLINGDKITYEQGIDFRVILPLIDE
ncbi:sensor histidine kinase [Spongiivirga citrea]|uniref:Signal transduction histidine kinase internal region domain-containing protein n=1 Tax=Spongiivirga citrea TaxID=1481457 RepID=A0A6M0CKM4_9FLAO|nr:histidine kinase [Spongiivirga citrea]NER16399.1 hypothetical protein [Spongiivirga citrea]